MYLTILNRATLGFIEKEEAFISGTLAFYALLAFFPFVIFLSALAGFYGDSETAEKGIHFLIDHAPKQIADVVLPVISEITTIENGGLLTLGLLGTLWVLMSGVDALRTGLNRAYNISERRSYLYRKLQSLGFVFFMAFSLVLVSIAIILGPLLLDILYYYLSFIEQWSWILNLIRYAFSFLVLMLMMSGVYYFLPNIHQLWRRVLPGAFVATLLWMGLASLFSLYLAHTNRFSVTYGSLSGIIIALVFLKASAIIFLFGAELNHAYLQYQHEENRGEN